MVIAAGTSPNCRLCMFYKAVNGHAACDIPDHMTTTQRRTRTSHNLQHAVPSTNTDSYRFSFFPHTIKIWNILPAASVTQMWIHSRPRSNIISWMGLSTVYTLYHPRDSIWPTKAWQLRLRSHHWPGILIARPPHQPPVILSGTPDVGLAPLTCGCWPINYISANIGHRNSIRILNQYPFWWNILIRS